MAGPMWDGISTRLGGESLTLRCQRSGARRVRINVQDLACGTVGIQVCDCGGSGIAFLQEYECYVVRLAILYQRLSMIIRLSISHILRCPVA